MKKLSLLLLLSAGMFMLSCGGNEEEVTEAEIAATEMVEDHACCSEECGTNCEIHAEEKETCEKKCDKSNCAESCTIDHAEAVTEDAEQEISA